MIKTVTTTAGINTVSFPEFFKYFWIKNVGDTTVYASAYSNVASGVDNTSCINSGDAVCIENVDNNNVYISGAGSVEIHAQEYPDCSFKVAPKGGDVVAGGNPVTLGGLQGGVPFSEMVVSGKNLIPYPYYYTTKTINGVMFTDNGDGSVTVNGTATANTAFHIFHPDMSNFKIPTGNYFISGTPENVGTGDFSTDPTLVMVMYTADQTNTIAEYGSGKQITITDDIIKTGLYIRIPNGYTANNLVFRPQLEIGSTPTEYEPPITGRNIILTVNGTETTITPDSNPYTVPNDIRQQDGLNNISVSAGEVSVTGVRKNAAIKRIWDEIDEIKTAIIVSNGESE